MSTFGNVVGVGTIMDRKLEGSTTRNSVHAGQPTSALPYITYYTPFWPKTLRRTLFGKSHSRTSNIAKLDAYTSRKKGEGTMTH